MILNVNMFICELQINELYRHYFITCNSAKRLV